MNEVVKFLQENPVQYLNGQKISHCHQIKPDNLQIFCLQENHRKGRQIHKENQYQLLSQNPALGLLPFLPEYRKTLQRI